MVGRLISFWDGLFSGVILVSGRVNPLFVEKTQFNFKTAVPDDCLKLHSERKVNPRLNRMVSKIFKKLLVLVEVEMPK